MPPCRVGVRGLGKPAGAEDLGVGIAEAICLVSRTALLSVIALISTHSAPVLATAAASGL